MAAKLYRYEVSHPEYGTTIVSHISEAGATQAAADVWGAPWAKIAGYCSVKKLGTAAKPRCKRCHKEFGAPGDVTPYCSDCLRAMEADRQRRKREQHRGPDRRAGMRE